ncbi:MAG: hypothetical protein AB1430_00900 [Pseudomonadota bacterium]
MRSRLLARLDAAIARTRDPVQLACLRAERAGFLGRHGQVELARGQLQELQRQFAARPHVAVSGWMALAEGQIEQYTHLGSATAYDRLKRAYALSAAAQLQPLQALSAAWLAHAHYLRDERERTAALCAEALRLAAPDHHGARWRACLTVAVGLHYTGRLDLAQPWYNSARQHALADGDDVALSSTIYNQAGLRADHARQAAAFEGVTGSQAVHAAMVMDSTSNFDAGIGLQSLDWLVPLLRAHLLVLEGCFEQALALFDEQQAGSPTTRSPWRERLQPCLLADRAWCLLQTGREEEARAGAQAAEQSLQQASCDVDDRALAHARLAELFARFGDAQRAARHRARAEQDHAAYKAQQAKALHILQEALGELRPA